MAESEAARWPTEAAGQSLKSGAPANLLIGETPSGRNDGNQPKADFCFLCRPSVDAIRIVQDGKSIMVIGMQTCEGLQRPVRQARLPDRVGDAQRPVLPVAAAQAEDRECLSSA